MSGFETSGSFYAYHSDIIQFVGYSRFVCIECLWFAGPLLVWFQCIQLPTFHDYATQVHTRSSPWISSLCSHMQVQLFLKYPILKGLFCTLL